MILMNDFKAEPQELRDDMLSAVSRVFESGWYVLGNEVEQFEKEWEKFVMLSMRLEWGMAWMLLRLF